MLRQDGTTWPTDADSDSPALSRFRLLNPAALPFQAGNRLLCGFGAQKPEMIPTAETVSWSKPPTSQPTDEPSALGQAQCDSACDIRCGCNAGPVKKNLGTP